MGTGSKLLFLSARQNCNKMLYWRWCTDGNTVDGGQNFPLSSLLSFHVRLCTHRSSALKGGNTSINATIVKRQYRERANMEGENNV